MELDVRRLLTLRAVRDAGGVLAAATALRISASAVSQQLSKLERETGLTLLDRSTSGRVRLTVAGLRLCERADAIAAELRTASRELSELTDFRSHPAHPTDYRRPLWGSVPSFKPEGIAGWAMVLGCLAPGLTQYSARLAFDTLVSSLGH